MSISEFAAEQHEEHPAPHAALAGRYDERQQMEARVTALEAQVKRLSARVAAQDELWGDLGKSMADMHDLLYQLIDEGRDPDDLRPE